MNIKSLLILSLCLILWANLKAQNLYNATHSGIILFDQFNKEINAHGACIVKEGDKYYLFGEYKSDTANVFTGFSCYSSTDLMNWKFERIALPVQKSGFSGANRVGERVKVMKCLQTGEFVMYMHTDDRNYKDPRICYATSKTIDGEYQFQGELLYQGKAIRKWDMGTFQDTDGKGYLLIHHGYIYELASDYKSAVRQMYCKDANGESPVVFKYKGIYYRLTSHTTSWERNDNFYLTSKSIDGTWTPRGVFCPPNSLTWNSQCTFALPISNGKDSVFMFMGDRWSFPKQGSAASYVFQPFTIKDSTLSIPEFYENWTIDSKTLQTKAFIPQTQIIKASIKGNWDIDKLSSNEKGATLIYIFKGNQVAIKALSNKVSGYGKVTIVNSKGKEVLSSIVDFYSLNETSSQKFLSPKLKTDTYTMSIEVLGEHPTWSDKKKSNYGSTDNFVSIEQVLLIK